MEKKTFINVEIEIYDFDKNNVATDILEFSQDGQTIYGFDDFN